MGFKERLREYRKLRGMTQLELANIIGMTKSSISNYEAGTSAPNDHTLIKIFNALNCEPNDLYQDDYTSAVEADEFLGKYRMLPVEGRRVVADLVDSLLQNYHYETFRQAEITPVAAAAFDHDIDADGGEDPAPDDY